MGKEFDYLWRWRENVQNSSIYSWQGLFVQQDDYRPISLFLFNTKLLKILLFLIVGHDQDSYRVVEWRVLVYRAVLPTVDWCRYVLSAPEVMIVYRYLHRSPTPPDRIPHQLARMFAVGSTPSPAVRHPDVCSRSVAQGAPGESLGKVRPIRRKLRMSAVWSVAPRQGSDTQFLRRQWVHPVFTSKVYHGYIMLWLSKQNTYRNVVLKTYLSFFLCFIYMF